MSTTIFLAGVPAVEGVKGILTPSDDIESIRMLHRPLFLGKGGKSGTAGADTTSA
jgi:hypothetical protein